MRWAGCRGIRCSELLGMPSTELLHPSERGGGSSSETGREHGTAGSSEEARQRTLVRDDGQPVICEVRYASRSRTAANSGWCSSRASPKPPLIDRA